MHSGLRIIIIIIIIIIVIYLIYSINKSEKIKAFRYLANLDQQQLTTYFNAYDQLFNDKALISTKDDFDKKLPPTILQISNNIKPSQYTADCYSILNALCTLGNVQKMYIPPCMDINKSFIENQNLYEEELAKDLNVKPGGILLDLGCGCGRIAHHISKLTDCTVYGTNIDKTQLESAKKFAKKNSYDKKTQFFFHDFNDTFPFKTDTFDAIYSVQALCGFVTNYDTVFKEIYRILKPGGRLYTLDGVILDEFDRNNPHHLKLVVGARQVGAAGIFQYYKYLNQIAKNYGFKIIMSRGGDPPNQALELPMLIKENQNFYNIEQIIKMLSYINIIPNYMVDLITRLRNGAEDLIEMEEKDLLTICWKYIFEKPTLIPY